MPLLKSLGLGLANIGGRLIRLPNIVNQYLSWTLNSTGWFNSESIDSVGSDNRPFVSGTYILAELGTAFNITGLLSTDEVWSIDFEGFDTHTVNNGSITLTEGESYGGFKVVRNNAVIGVFPVIEGAGTTIINQIRDGVLGNCIISGSTINIWKFSAEYSNTANDLGYAVADGSTMYYDVLHTLLIPEGVVIPVDLDNTSLICAYDNTGTQISATYTNTAKINLIANTPTLIVYDTDNQMDLNNSDFSDLVGATINRFRWETTCILTSNASFEYLFYLYCDSTTLNNVIQLFDSSSEGIYGTFLGTDIKSTDFGSAVHFPIGEKNTYYLEFDNGTLKIGWTGESAQEFSVSSVTPQSVTLLDGFAWILRACGVGTIFYNSKVELNGDLIGEFVNFGTTKTYNLEKETTSLVSGTVVDLKTYVSDGETYHYRNGFKNWIKDGEADIPAILGNNGGEIDDYSGDGYAVEETVNAGFTGIHSSIDNLYNYEMSQLINYQLPELYTDGQPNLSTYAEIAEIDNAGVLLTDEGNSITDLRVFNRNSENITVPEGYGLIVAKVPSFNLNGIDNYVQPPNSFGDMGGDFTFVWDIDPDNLPEANDTMYYRLGTSINTLRIAKSISLDRLNFIFVDNFGVTKIIEVGFDSPDFGTNPYRFFITSDSTTNEVTCSVLSLTGSDSIDSREIELESSDLSTYIGARPSVNHSNMGILSLTRYDYHSLNWHGELPNDYTERIVPSDEAPEMYMLNSGEVLPYEGDTLNTNASAFGLYSAYYANGFAKYSDGSCAPLTDAGVAIVRSGLTVTDTVTDPAGNIYSCLANHSWSLNKNDAKTKLIDENNVFIDLLGDLKYLDYSAVSTAILEPYVDGVESNGEISGVALIGTYSIVPNYQMPYSAPYYALDIVDDLVWKTDTERVLVNNDYTPKQYLYSELTALQSIPYIQITLNGEGNPITFKLIV